MQMLVNKNSSKVELADVLNNLKRGRFAGINLHSWVHWEIAFLNLSWRSLASQVIMMSCKLAWQRRTRFEWTLQNTFNKMCFPDIRQKKKPVVFACFVPVTRVLSISVESRKWCVASVLLYSDAFAFMCFLLIYLQGKCRGVLMHVERSEIL